MNKNPGVFARVFLLLRKHFMERIDTPRGTRDFPPQQASVRQRVEQQVCQVFASYGYQPVQTPIFENFDLFAARSGEEIIESMLTFSVDAVRVALRPEMTSAICRLAAAGKLAKEASPHKLYYFGPCFRYCRPQEGRHREFHQMGVELVGVKGPLADAETIAVAVSVLRQLGIEEYSLRLGGVGVFRQMLLDGEGVGREAQDRVLHDVDRLVHLLEKSRGEDPGELSADDAAFVSRERFAIAREQQNTNYDGPHKLDLSADTSDENPFPTLIAALEATVVHAWESEGVVARDKGDKLVQLTKLRGRDEAFWAVAGKLTAGTSAEQELAGMRATCDYLQSFGVNDFEVELGVVRNLDFYTGMVFEIDLPLLGAKTQVCGGGRYDRLIEEFGGSPTPATGFAFGFDRLVSAYQKANSGELNRPSVADVAVFASDASLSSACVELAGGLRAAGLKVVTDLAHRSKQEQQQYARDLGVHRTIVLTPEMVERKVCSFITWKNSEPIDRTEVLLNAQEIAERFQAEQSARVG